MEKELFSLGGAQILRRGRDCKVVLFLSQEPETGGSPSSRYLGRLLAPIRTGTTTNLEKF